MRTETPLFDMDIATKKKRKILNLGTSMGLGCIMVRGQYTVYIKQFFGMFSFHTKVVKFTDSSYCGKK